METKEFNIKEIKEEVNYILFNNFDFGLRDLKLSNEILKKVEDTVNEILNISNNYN